MFPVGSGSIVLVIGDISTGEGNINVSGAKKASSKRTQEARPGYSPEVFLRS